MPMAEQEPVAEEKTAEENAEKKQGIGKKLNDFGRKLHIGHRRVKKGVKLKFINFKAWGAKIKQLWDTIREDVKHKHRFVVMDSQTYKEKLSFQLSGINLFVTIGISIIVLVVLTSLLIAFTPLRELIPGYTNPHMVEQTYKNAHMVDSLEQQLANQERMLADIKDVMMGNDPAARHKGDSTQNEELKEVSYTHSKADSLLRKEMETADKYQLHPSKNSGNQQNNASHKEAVESVSFQLLFSPMKGKVISQYDPKVKHYGVDIAGTTNETIKAVQSGTVLFSEFSVETGYVVMLQHQGGMISIYKHCSTLLKKEGEMVRAGEPIGYLGNSGSLSSGPHLHFELWVNGSPANPLQYVSF